jgi:hypothetical protein
MHENQKMFGPNLFITQKIHIGVLTPSKCLFKWIKVDKKDYPKKHRRDFKNYFYFGIV